MGWKIILRSNEIVCPYRKSSIVAAPTVFRCKRQGNPLRQCVEQHCPIRVKKRNVSIENIETKEHPYGEKYGYYYKPKTSDEWITCLRHYIKVCESRGARGMWREFADDARRLIHRMEDGILFISDDVPGCLHL